MSIGFWETKDGSFRSSYKGLAQEQVEFLRSLKVGDRLVLFPARPDDQKSAPDFNLLLSTVPSVKE